MDPARKVLIFHASAGHGHEMAAKAVEAAYRRLRPQHRIELYDTLALSGRFSGGVYREAYLVQIKHVPWLWGFFYYSLDLPWIYAVARHARRALNAWTCASLERLLLDRQPDVVIATHFQALEVASHLKSSGRLRAKLVAVVTDYLPHHVWTAEGIDGYAVAHDETASGLVRRGARAERIRVTGIPVDPKFGAAIPRDEAAGRLGLDPAVFTVLVTSGGVGVASMEDIVRSLLGLRAPLQAVVVCGHNEALRARIERLAGANPRWKIFGFVRNMDELMSAADVLAGKGGGLTTTESFVKGNPVVLFRPLPGQEARNAALFEKLGCGFSLSDPRRLAETISRIAGSAALLGGLRQAAAGVARADAAARIVEWAES